jgi:serine/threonine protein kinase
MVLIMNAVSYLHNQQPPIIHRDIKPANIIVPPSGNEAVLVDLVLLRNLFKLVVYIRSFAMDRFKPMVALRVVTVVLIIQAIAFRMSVDMVHEMLCLHRAWFRVLISIASVTISHSTPARFLPCHR